jgi:hypothetical protein
LVSSLQRHSIRSNRTNVLVLPGRENLSEHPFYKMARNIHSIGNATTKLHLTRLYVNIAQNNMSHEAYIEQINSMVDTFKLSFNSIEHPGYVSLSELKSFFYLTGLIRTEFQRAIDEISQNNPTGRFPDPGSIETDEVEEALEF